MSPTIDKLPNRKALNFFSNVLKMFTFAEATLVMANIVTKSKLVQYECWLVESMVVITGSLMSNSELLNIGQGSTKLFVVFAYSPNGEKLCVIRSEV